MPKAPLPPEVIQLRGTRKPTRPRERIVEPVPGVPRKPAWLKGRAARIWREKLAIYTRRGQNVVGCEANLAIYCRLEATILDDWDAGRPPTAALLSAYQRLCAAFYDAPAYQIRSMKPERENPFMKHGKKPKE